MTSTTQVSDEELATYFDELSNWGRWGADDGAGTLNLLTPEVVRSAAALVTEGTSVGCARPLGSKIAHGGPANQYLHFMIGSGEAAPHDGPATAGDWFGIGCHGFEFTHIDAHSHFFWQGKMYNDRPAELCTSSRGALAGGIEPTFDGIIGRGVLVDGPALRGKPWLEIGEGLGPDELDAWMEQKGIEPQPGDILFVRTGRDAWEAAGDPAVRGPLKCPGLDAACLPWLRRHDVSILAGDCTNDAMPSGHEAAVQWVGPIHAVGLVSMGMWLIDNAELGALRNACEERDRWSFFTTMTPLPMKRATGAPVNPVAVF